MDFSEFLATGWGMAIFIIVDLAVLVLILALNYKWLFKRVLDVLFSFVFLAVFFVRSTTRRRTRMRRCSFRSITAAKRGRSSK